MTHPPHPKLDELIAVLEQLRAPGGCAWDQEQTHESLVKYLVEETYELIDAIESGNRDELIEELGDVLYQVVFHADIASSTPGEEFTLEDVAEHMTRKMVGRHPHVFGDDAARAELNIQSADDVVAVWDDFKATEKPARTSVLDGIPQGMPALALADKVIGRAQKIGVLDADAVAPVVTEDSPLLDKSIAEAQLGEKFGVYPLELLRGDRRMWSPREQKLTEGDVLLVRGDWEKIQEFQRQARLRNAPESRYAWEQGRRRVLAEIMVAPASPVEGRTLSEIGLDWHYRGAVVAVHRRGGVLREKLSNVRLALGDVLLMLVDEEAMPKLRNDEAFVVLSERDDVRGMSRKAAMAASIMVAVVVLSGMHWLPIPIAAVCGAVAMALTGCFGRKDVYEGMDWKIIILLGAILPLGLAIENTGLSTVVVAGAMQLIGGHGPLAALLTVYLLTALLTELMGHNPSVVLMVGIAVTVAHAVQADPRPFVVAVAFAAATSFATPVGYPTNTMVYYAGGYRFTDFMKVGIPLIALFCALSMWLIPLFWPFHPQ